MQTHQYLMEHFVGEMASYPNILTPPMDTEMIIFPPKSETFSPNSKSTTPPPLVYMPTEAQNLMQLAGPKGYYIEAPVPESEYNNVYLMILEEPLDKFRFRYKSEMAGTHGSLNGRASDRCKRQTYPSVKLEHYNGSALIRCSLSQIIRKEPHAHRLVKKVGTEEMDDPHDIEVGPELGYGANFMGMGIIHTARKFIVSELVRKYTILKRDEISRTEGFDRPLLPAEEAELKKKAESESNHINLNQVRLKFEAFRKEGSILFPICKPVYSGIINNLKSALTGDLKIVRMDHCTSPSRGGREIFILVEKVTKKNIRVRIFELDDDDNEVWSSFGSFSDLDVHHQYAIVFKTPPYRNIDIDKPVKVCIELQRPSDGARSEAKDFSYTPCEIIQGRKRLRTSYSSTNSSSSTFTSSDLPMVLPNNVPLVDSKELEDALERGNICSAEIEKILALIKCNDMEKCYTSTEQTLALDTPTESRSRPHSVDGRFNRSEEAIFQRIQKDVVNFFKTVQKPSKAKIEMMLQKFLCGEEFKVSNGNNILHSLVLKPQTFLLKLIKALQKYELGKLADVQNKLGQTALHLAVTTGNITIIELLLKIKVDVAIQDMQGNTALHFAIMREAPNTILNLFQKYNHESGSYINITNEDGNTALHLAIKMNNVNATKVLAANQADINYPAKTNGYTALHMAVADQHIAIVMFLLENGCDTSIQDYCGNSALKLAKVLIDEDKPNTKEIYDILENHMKRIGNFQEVLIKEEDPLEDSSDLDIMELEVKFEPRSVPKDLLQTKYKQMTNLTDRCSLQVANILNASGSWKRLAEALGHGHMIRAEIFTEDGNPAMSFLDFLLAKGENLLTIRTLLNVFGESEAVGIMDNMVKDELDSS